MVNVRRYSVNRSDEVEGRSFGRLDLKFTKLLIFDNLGIL